MDWERVRIKRGRSLKYAESLAVVVLHLGLERAPLAGIVKSEPVVHPEGQAEGNGRDGPEPIREGFGDLRHDWRYIRAVLIG